MSTPNPSIFNLQAVRTNEFNNSHHTFVENEKSANDSSSISGAQNSQYLSLVRDKTHESQMLPNIILTGYSLLINDSLVKARIQKYYGTTAYLPLGESFPGIATRQFLPSGFDQETKKEIGSVRIAIHGWGGTAAMFDHMGRAAQIHPTTPSAFISVDLPGHGNSAAPNSFEYDNPIGYVVVLHALIQNIKAEFHVEKVSLVGHSMGGGVAFLYALLFPEDISDLDLMNPWAYEGLPLAKSKANHKVIQNMKPGGMSFLVAVSSGTQGRRTFKKNPQISASLRAAFEKNHWKDEFGFVAHNQVLLDSIKMKWSMLQDLLVAHPELSTDLTNQVSVNLMRAGIDVVVPKKYVNQLAKQIGIDESDIVVIRKAGHQTPFSESALDAVLKR